jgi:prefoldin subunit 5
LTERDEAEALEEEAKSLRKQISSMQQRFEILSKLAGTDKSPENNNQLLADVASVNDQVPAL